MRDTGERCAAVRRRAERLRWRRTDRALAVLVCLMALPLVDLAGRTAATAAANLPAAGSNLFGATSLFGSDIGGYMLVALIAAVAAVLVTVLCVRSRREAKKEDALEDETHSANNAD